MLGVLIASLAFARDVFDWQVGAETAAPSATPTGVPVADSSTGSGPASSPQSAPSAAVRLDTLPVEAGAANLVKLPRPLADRPEYERAIVIGCPTNAGADNQREVAFRVQRRFLDLNATVRPHFPSPDDREGVVIVHAQVAIRNADGTVSRVNRGQQFDARMDTPRGLVADLDGADELILRVECEFPGGSVVFTDATVSRG
ncbi:hypothetical protein [Micromonospora peucetia]|uniref:Uncharacterized protein n=1 Tax=Micromonospora peucetia TaxID=47871 RepID=A0A1C6W5K1_9ACTN|nr:hypothetical protein [Micromonospora peucetia]WSA35901.1 hypothetical protein OIE14_01655 [Micromonospora peucetia]SCL73812.1 hypothetical protein GA0070608_6127 [Micromonospora peucetia]